MCEIKGPYRDRKKWRVRVIDTATAKQTNHIFASQEEAQAAIPRLEAEYRRPVGLPMAEVLDAFQDHLRTRGNIASRGPNRPRTVETTMGRLRRIFATDVISGELTSKQLGELWASWVETKATDTALNALAQVRTFLGWMERRGWTKAKLGVEIEVVGARRKGKRRLTEDQAAVFHTEAKRRADAGDDGAAATLVALYLGIRASELMDRLVGDVDAKGTKLIIPHAKTEAGIRRLIIPVAIRPYFARWTSGRDAGDRLLPFTRHWLLRQVKRLCLLANVPVVTAHGLRGTASDLAQAAGMIGDAVASSLGHESYRTTLAHYTDPSVPANAQIQRVVDALN